MLPLDIPGEYPPLTDVNELSKIFMIVLPKVRSIELHEV